MHPMLLHARAALHSLGVARDRLLFESQRFTTAGADWDDRGTLQAWRPGEERTGTAVRRDPLGDAIVANRLAAIHVNPYEERLSSIHETLSWLARSMLGQQTLGDPLPRLHGLLRVLNPSPDSASNIRLWVEEQDQAARKLLGCGDDHQLLPHIVCPACYRSGVLAIRTSAPTDEQVVVCTVGCLCVGDQCRCRMGQPTAGIAHVWTLEEGLIRKAVP